MEALDNQGKKEEEEEEKKETFFTGETMESSSITVTRKGKIAISAPSSI